MPDASQALYASMPARIISTSSKAGHIGYAPHLPPRLVGKMRPLGCNELYLVGTVRYSHAPPDTMCIGIYCSTNDTYRLKLA